MRDALSSTMQWVLEYAPATARPIPKEVCTNTNPMTIRFVRFSTIRALHERAYVTLFKRRDRWYWRRVC
jgi:hypothetical protein